MFWVFLLIHVHPFSCFLVLLKFIFPVSFLNWFSSQFPPCSEFVYCPFSLYLIDLFFSCFSFSRLFSTFMCIYLQQFLYPKSFPSALLAYISPRFPVTDKEFGQILEQAKHVVIVPRNQNSIISTHELLESWFCLFVLNLKWQDYSK